MSWVFTHYNKSRKKMFYAVLIFYFWHQWLTNCMYIVLNIVYTFRISKYCCCRRVLHCIVINICLTKLLLIFGPSGSDRVSAVIRSWFSEENLKILNVKLLWTVTTYAVWRMLPYRSFWNLSRTVEVAPKYRKPLTLLHPRQSRPFCDKRCEVEKIDL